ncbi:tetratricopeptide repeat protein [Sulfitobacter sp. JB4-11]|uniref:tetratricopeptide repeat protein n=1 Tax=Sulfitobacter rhodophyticola TaxID=3238304 RepID=UPI00351756E0
MKYFVLAAALTLPFGATSMALAAGGGNESAPKKPKCQTGLVYDKKTKTCVNAQESSLDVDTLYQTVRSLAYAGRYDDAQTVLAAMPQDDDRTLTYMGFTNRKMGNVDTAMAFYTRAIEVNPSNVLARSYMGQGLVEMGQIPAAIKELHAIRAHGGTGTWAEASLAKAIATGETFNY